LPWKDLDGEYSHPTLNRDGTALACVSPNMSICVTDPKTGFELRTVPTGLRRTAGDVHRLALDPDASLVLVEDIQSHELKLWDLTASSAARTLALLYLGFNWVVAVSPDAKSATCVSQHLSGPADKKYDQIAVVNLVSGRRAERSLSIPFRSVHDL